MEENVTERHLEIVMVDGAIFLACENKLQDACVGRSRYSTLLARPLKQIFCNIQGLDDHIKVRFYYVDFP